MNEFPMSSKNYAKGEKGKIFYRFLRKKFKKNIILSICLNR